MENIPEERRAYETALPDTVTVVFERAEELDGFWCAHSPEMPGVITQGENLADAIDMFRDAYELMSEEITESPRP